MRKLYPLFFLLFSIVTYSRAQNPTPNAGFEDWTLNNESYYTPNDWSNLNPETSFLGALTCYRCDTAHSGNYAVELVTDSINGEPPANGIITTGVINIIAETVTGGVPYTLRPDSMYGYYRYYPTKGDSTDIQFGVYDNDGNTIGLASFTSGATVTTYTRFSVPITYTSSATPDTSRWLISSSNGHKSFIGSRLYVDDIGVAFNSSGINNPTVNPITISISPNPASNFITISNPKLTQGIFSLFNILGEEVKQIQLNSELQNVDVQDLTRGVYLYTVKYDSGTSISNGKIVLN